ncbi:LysR family transcriptional regulator AphB [Pseudoalteromonas sp. MBR-15]|uniref:LysR family transcriptional regulator n=1 Tax=Pseudoalteromonas lipolytica TaxID=570156 RepID=UPI003BA00966
MMIDDIALFIHIVKQGGVTAAADYLSVPAATVSRRLQRLEQRVGEKLLNRTARQCTLTHVGEVYFQSYVELVEQFEQTHHQLNDQKAKLTGKLKVLAPLNISHGFLKPMWLAFTKHYPEIQLELLLNNQRDDLSKNQADIAIRIGPQTDSHYQQKKLGSVDTLFVSTERYLSDAPSLSTPADLRQHRLIGTTLRNKWQLNNLKTGETQTYMCRFASTFNDTGFVKYLVCDGQGVALLPRFEIIDELKSGQLKQVLPLWRGENREIYAIWPSGRLLSKKAVCLKQFVTQFISETL